MAETDLIAWGAQHVSGYAFTDDDSQSVVATYPTRENTASRFYVPFDDTDEEGILFEGIMPQGYDSGQDLKLDVYYIMASATSGKVDFQASVEAITDADTTDLDAGTSFDSANAGNATVPGTAGHMDVITITLSNKDSVAAGDYFRVRVHRDSDDGTNDTAAGDAHIIYLRLYQETT